MMMLSNLMSSPLIKETVLVDSFVIKLKKSATWWNRLLNYSRCCTTVITFLSPLVSLAEIAFTYPKQGNNHEMCNFPIAPNCFQMMHYPDIMTNTNYFSNVAIADKYGK